MQMLNQLTKLLAEKKGSDIHLLEGEKPRVRIHGDLVSIESKEHTLVTRADIESILDTCLTTKQRSTFEETMDIDFSVEMEGASGRVNVGLANGGKLYLTMRYLPANIIPLEELGIDAAMLRALAGSEDGLIVVAGETSSGKTTTIAAMLEYINRTRRGAITTIENPVEYVLHSDKCLITRREVGRDTPDFKPALRSSVRKNPDVLLIGEVRDSETAGIAMAAAETGIQAFCTLHATSTLGAITRLANIMISEGHKEEEFYHRLSLALRGIVHQQLARRADGKGLTPLYEILNVTHTEKEYLREMNFARLEQNLETEHNISLGLCLYRLWHAKPRIIDEEVIRKVYGSRFNIVIHRLEDRDGYKPLVSQM
jgi:twitching motility protein PilT